MTYETARALMAPNDADLLHHLETILCSESLALDAFDEVYDKLCMALSVGTPLQEAVRVRAWLFRVAHNLAIDILRKREPLVPLCDTPVECRALSEVEHRLDALRAMRHLPGPLRDVFALRAQGAQHDEIARLLRVPEGTVRRRHCLAMQMMREWLKPRARRRRKHQRCRRVYQNPAIVSMRESTVLGQPCGR